MPVRIFLRIAVLCIFFGVGRLEAEGKRGRGPESVDSLQTLVLEPFEGGCGWRPYAWNTANGSVRLLKEASAGAAAAPEKDARPAGEHSAELVVHFEAGQFQWYIYAPAEPLKLTGRVKEFRFWLKGAGTGHYLELQFFDRRGTSQKLPCGTLASTRWQKVTIPVPEDWAQPLSLRGLCLHNWELPDPVDLVVRIDQLEVVTDPAYDFKGFSHLDEIEKKLATGVPQESSFGEKDLDRQALITQEVTAVRPRQEPKDVEIYFTDDFMRSDAQGASWEPLKGEWKIASISDHKRADPRLSANAFCYHGRGKPTVATVIAKDTPEVTQKVPKAVLRIDPADGIREGMEFVALNPMLDDMTGEPLIENVWVINKVRVTNVAGANAVGDLLGDEFLWESLTGGTTIFLDRMSRYQEGVRWLDPMEVLELKQNSIEAVTFSGYRFWRDYSVEVAAKALSEQGFGVYLYYQDKDNYYLLMCPAGPGASVRFLKCVQGTTTVLAEKNAHLQPGFWYLLTLSAFRGHLLVKIDTHEIFQVQDSDLQSGQFGFYASGPEGAFFDDVLVQSVPTFLDEFDDSSLARWEKVRGDWAVRSEGGAALVAPTGTGEGMLVAGLPDWKGYTLSLLHRVPEKGSAEILFDMADPKRYLALETRRGRGGVEIRLIRELDGKRVELVQAEAAHPAGSEPLPFEIESYQARIDVRVAGKPVLEWVETALQKGRIGLRATGSSGAAFGRVLVTFGLRKPPTLAINKVFAGADTMENWAGLMSDWTVHPEGERRVIWNRKDFYGNLSVGYQLADVYKKGNRVGLMLYGDGDRSDSGYTAVFDWTAGGQSANVMLYRRGKRLASGRVENLWEARTGSIRREGHFVLVSVDEQGVLLAQDADPLTGTRIGAWSVGEGLDVSQIEAYSDNMHNYVFDRSAVEWRAETGHWRIVNRWSCSPQWSWLGGESPSVASLWHKQSFRGDVTLDFYAAPKMGSAYGAGVIETAEDMNISLCADGKNLGSGYAFIYGGWRNTYTRILRKGKTVAETRDVLPPSWRESNPLAEGLNNLHRRWFHFTVVKKGPKIQYLVDNELALEYVDPEPLNEGWACIWTVTNGLMVARARLSYTQAGEWEYPLVPNPPAEELRRSAAIAEFLSQPGVDSPTHPIRFSDFNHTLGSWQAVDHPQAARLSLAERTPGSGDRVLRLVNPHGGGHFEARCITEPFDVRKLSVLSFDYRVTPDVKLNFYLTIQGMRYGVVFTGNPDEMGDVPTLATIPNVVADGQWHHASVDLKPGAAGLFPRSPTLRVEEMILGCYEEGNYLVAGFGGNPAGATLYLDHFALGGPGEDKARFTWWDRGSNGIKQVSYVLDRNPETIPDDTPEVEKNLATFRNLEGGIHYFHLKGLKYDKEWSPTAHYRIEVDNRAPAVEWLSPPEGASWGGSRAQARILDLEGSAIDVEALEVQWQAGDSAPVAWRPGRNALVFDPLSGLLTFQLDALPEIPQTGTKVRLGVTACRDSLGNALAEPSWRNWTVDWRQDRDPPVLSVWGSSPCFRHDTFEDGLGDWAVQDAGVYLSRNTRQPSRGRYALKAFNRLRGAFQVTAVREDFSAGKYPILAFDYRIGPGIHVDLLLKIQEAYRNIVFTDNDGQETALGVVPDVLADGQWHHAEVNLLEVLSGPRSMLSTLKVQTLGFGGTGYSGNARGDSYEIDEFQLVPAVSTARVPLGWEWTATDIQGSTSFEYAFGPSNESPAWKPGKEQKVSFSRLGRGRYAFLCRARDLAGNWSETYRQDVVVDDFSPECGTPAPADGEKAASRTISIPLRDPDSGIDLEKSSLMVAGTKYLLSDPPVCYSTSEGLLTWDSARVQPEAVQFQEAQKIDVALAACDHAGNSVERAWIWVMTYKADKAGPQPPLVTFRPPSPLLLDDFENSQGLWRPYMAFWRREENLEVAVERSTSDPVGGRFCLKMTNRWQNGSVGTVVYRDTRGFDALEFPIVSFDYKASPGLKLDFMVKRRLESPWLDITFTDDDNIHKNIGRVEGAAADGQWHHAEFDLGRMLQEESPDAGEQRLVLIILADYGTRTNPIGASLHVDNFSISKGLTPGDLSVSWTLPSDPTGITAFASALDDDPDTVPDEAGGLERARVFPEVTAGEYFFHLRARDGAGNWGDTRHVPIVVRAAADGGPPDPAE
ncbi:MAG: hypothetical protein HYU36_19930 [Planctomycetes bacterium]|nr:hypothetical protein [Planctomycetota bacterium]